VGEYAIHRALAHGQKVFYTHAAEGPSQPENCAISRAVPVPIKSADEP